MILLPLIAFAVTTTGVLARGTYSPNSRIFGRVIGRGPTDRNVAYLTFDDGPNASATPAILETLARHKISASFFMVGVHVNRYPEIARHVAAAGHSIGNHTNRHRKLDLSGPVTVRAALREAHESIANATGVEPRMFRAPHGYRNPFVAAEVRRLGYTAFGWTFGVWDTDSPGGEEIRARVRARLRNGAIILLHDGDGYDPAGNRSQTAAALEGIIEDGIANGFEFHSLAELLDG